MEATFIPLVLFYAFLWTAGVWGALVAALVWSYGALARRLRSGDFDRVAASFDEIVYGRRAPQPPDLELSREGWRTVLATAGAG